MTRPVPRPFQERAMRNVGAKLRDGSKGVCLVSPTGSGKTFMGSMMVAELARTGKRIAWGAHREELLVQAANTLRAFGLAVGLRGVGSSAPVQLFTYQEAVASGKAPEADYFVPDECHHLGDKVGWERIAFGYIAAIRRIIGLTATPSRSDGRALPAFDSLVVAAQIRDLVREGLLVPLRWRGPTAALASQKIAQKPVEAYLAEASGRCAVVFAPNINAAKAYLADFLAAGVRAKLVTGDMPDDERDQALAEHVTGAIDVLVNVNLLTEGWDNPRCDCVIVARGCGAIVLWIQMAGRGLRPHCGCGKLKRGLTCSCLKADCLLLDLRGVAHELGRPDAEATYSLEGAGIVLAQDTPEGGPRLCKLCRVPLPEGELVCTECGTDHAPKVPKAVGAPLTDWDLKWEAAKVATNPSKPVLSLAGIYRKADEAARAGKPWKQGAAERRFMFIMNRRPYPQEMAAARNLLRAAEKFEPEQRRLGV